MKTVLVVSKPLAPPWNDGSKNLARDVADALTRHRAAVFVPHRTGRTDRIERAVGEGVAFRLGRRESALIAWGIAVQRASLAHFFFAPNPRTSSIARSLVGARSLPAVQTVASAPAASLTGRALVETLFGDVVTTMSERTRRRLVEAGVDERRVRVVLPSAPPRPLPDPVEVARFRAREVGGDRPVIFYPGDLEHGRGADVMLAAFARLRGDALLWMATRAKSPRAAARRVSLEAEALRLGIGERVRWLGELPRIDDWIAAADIVALPADDLSAKVDLPLVLVEAAFRGRPVLVSRGVSAEELSEHGVAVATPFDVEALVAELGRWLDDAELRAAIGARAHAQAHALFTPASMAGRFESMYDEIAR